MKFWRKSLWLAMIAGVATAVFVTIPPSKGETQSGIQATVIATASVRGEVTPCG